MSKVSKAPSITPKRRRIASMLDAVMESTRALTPAPAKKIAEAATTRAETEARPSVPTEESLLKLSRELKELQMLVWLWRKRTHPK